MTGLSLPKGTASHLFVDSTLPSKHDVVGPVSGSLPWNATLVGDTDIEPADTGTLRVTEEMAEGVLKDRRT